jgi:hypothetical protein
MQQQRHCWKRGFPLLSVPRHYKGDSWGNRVSSVREFVRKRGSWKGAAVQRGLERVKLRISSVRSRCQRTTAEGTTGWKRLRGCCGDLLIVEISGGAVINCSSESCV